MKKLYGVAITSLVAGLVVVGALVGGPAPVAEIERDVPDVRARLEDEARDALPHAAPTGVTHEIELVAAPTTLPLLDGRQLDVWAYDGQVPGPFLRARVGDKLRVRLTNRLPQPTSIHWHGVRLPNPMDGVPGVTQPAVKPGETFVYEFVLPDAGTFWYHPHFRGSEQVERGLHGMLIVEPAHALPSRELAWVLDDWKLDSTGQVHPQFVTRGDLAHDGRWGSVLTVNAQSAPRFEVRPGETLRIRMVNAANGRVFAPDFTALGGRLVGYDGPATAGPLAVEGLELAPGNRADVELTVGMLPPGTILPITSRFGRSAPLLAELVVAGDPAPAVATIDHASAIPRWAGAEQLEPDIVFRLAARRGGPYGLEWTINDEAMRMEDPDATSAGPARYRLENGRFTTLRFVNESARLHPMHLHGQFFKVLARNGVPVDERHWRDTVLVRPRETVDVGVLPADEGSWVLHCHIFEHHDSGMMTVVAVGS